MVCPLGEICFGTFRINHLVFLVLEVFDKRAETGEKEEKGKQRPKEEKRMMVNYTQIGSVHPALTDGVFGK